MIKIVNGDLLKASETIIAHQVNCQGKMNLGLAKQIRNTCPNVYNDYKKLCNRESPYELLGETQLIMVDKTRYVANIFAQLDYGRKPIIYTDYDALFKGLKYIKDLAKENNKSVALPFGLGCGLAGGSWNEVYGIIEDVFSDYEVTLYKL